MAAPARPTGFDAFMAVQETAAPEASKWYWEGFYDNLFHAGGRVDVRYKQLLRLKLSKIQGCHT